MLSFNPNLATLPTDLVKIIYNYLPIKDQQLTAPRISRIWRSIAFQISGESMNINHGLDLSGKEIEIVNKICMTTNFISTIRKKKLMCIIGHGSCSMFSTNFSTENKEGQNLTARGHNNGYDGCSEFFPINWNPSTQELSFEEGHYGNFRSSYAIQVHLLKFTYEDTPIIKTLSPSTWGGFSVDYKHLFSWKEVDSDTVQPPKMNKHIDYALDLQMKLYMRFLTHINMIFLSKINVDSEIILECNSTGRIIQLLPVGTTLTEGQFILRITIKRLPGDIPYLLWEASDHSQNEEHRCLLTSALRWCVYSSTTQSLGKKMGLKINKHPVSY